MKIAVNTPTGKIGRALSGHLLDAGAEVVLVSGPVNLPAPAGVRRVDVETAEQMMDAVRAELADTDVFIAAAAVSDYRPVQAAAEKIKKTSDSLMLALSRTTDILATVAAGTPRPFVVGFAAETQNVERNALAKLEGKRLDMIAANQVGDNLAFDCDDNALTVYWPDGKRETLAVSSFLVLASIIAGARHHHECAIHDVDARGIEKPHILSNIRRMVQMNLDPRTVERYGKPIRLLGLKDQF